LYNNVDTIIGSVFLLVIVFITIFFSAQKKWAVLLGLLWFLFFAVPPTVYRLENADTFFNYLEHRTYLPMIGLVIIVGYFLQDRLLHPGFKKIFPWIYLPVLLIFGVMAVVHCADYKDSFTLRNRADLLDNPSALSGRAGEYLSKGDTVNALADINKAIELNNKDATMYFERGKIMARLQKHEEAEQDFSLALSMQPRAVDALLARSIEKRVLKKYESGELRSWTRGRRHPCGAHRARHCGILSRAGRAGISHYCGRSAGRESVRVVPRTDVWPFPAISIPAGTMAAADSSSVRSHLAMRTAGSLRHRRGLPG